MQLSLKEIVQSTVDGNKSWRDSSWFFIKSKQVSYSEGLLSDICKSPWFTVSPKNLLSGQS